MIIFNIDNIKNGILGIRLLKSNTLSFLNAIIFPFKSLLNDFYIYYSLKRFELAFNGQVIYLEKILNLNFDPDEGIYITDSPSSISNVVLFQEVELNEQTIFYQESENQTDVVFYQENEILNSPSFIVNVPTGLNFNLNQLTATINKYKISGKNFTINYY